MLKTRLLRVPLARGWPRVRWQRLAVVVLVVGTCVLASPVVSAHGVSSKDARYLLSLDGPAMSIQLRCPATLCPITNTMANNAIAMSMAGLAIRR